MKKSIRVGIILLAAVIAISGCAPLVDEAEIPESFLVYASFYPVYALSEMIIRDVPGMTLRLLIQPQDGCLRSYSLSDWDAYLLSASADAVILCGGGLEAFSGALQEMGEMGPAVVQACDALVLKNGGESESLESEDHFSGPNPWVFLSVDGAEQMIEAICANMIALDAPYEEKYLENLNCAEEKLESLKEEIQTILEGCNRTAKVALAHEGLVYFTDEWSLNVACVLKRESGTTLSAEATEAMLRQMKDSGADYLIIEKQAPAELVQAFEDAGIVVILFDTLSTGTEKQGADGYFSAMAENARSIRDGLRKQPD